MWLDSFKSLSLNDTPSKPNFNRSMSLNELTPQKRIRIEQKVHCGPSGEAVFRQYSYEELDVVPGTSSLRLSKKFVSEFNVGFSDSDKFQEFARIQKHSEYNFQKYKKLCKDPDIISQKLLLSPEGKDFDFRKFSVLNKETFSPNLVSASESEVPGMAVRQGMNKNKYFKRKRLLRLIPNRFSSMSTDSVNGLLSEKSNDMKSTPRSLMSSCVLWIILPVLVIIIATLGTQFAIHRKTCETKFDINTMEYLLSTTIFGQEKAIGKIVDIFKGFYSSDQDGLQVVVFTGNTGVGKTFTASLLEETFPWRFNIHHFIMPVDLSKLSSDSLYNYPFCGDHLVILDNLREEDVNEATQVVSYLKSLATKKRVVAILIFKFHKEITEIPPQIEVMKMGSEIQSKLAQNAIKNEIVYFRDLDKNDVIQCIKEALSRHWIPVSDNTVNTILEQVDYRREGCKRITSKIAIVNDIWSRNE